MPYKLLPEEPKEPTLTPESAIRIPAQMAASALATAPGVFGDTLKTLDALVAAPISKLIHGESTPYEQTPIGKAIPTTKQHRETLEKSFPYLKPKNPLEKFAGNIASDTASMYLGGRIAGAGKYGMSPARSLGVSMAGNGVGELVGDLTGDPSKGDIAKSATMVGLSLFSPMTAKKAANESYSQAASKLPSSAEENASSLSSYLRNLENKILQGRPRGNVSPSEEFVLKEADKFRALIDQGKVSIPQLVAQKRSFNETLQNHLFNIPNRSERARAKELAKGINWAARDTMKQYGKTNPDWWKLQSQADQAHGAIAESNFVSRVLGNYMKGRPEGLAHLLGIGAPVGIGLASTGGAAGAMGAYQAAKLGMRIWNSPLLREHYAKVVGAALSKNPKQINEALDNLQKEPEFQKTGRYKLID